MKLCQPSNRRKLLLLVASSALAILSPSRLAAHSASPPHVHAWARWEATLTSSATYTNPYRHLLLQVAWTCLSNCSTPTVHNYPPVYGFWDGGAAGRTFKLRANFRQPLGSASTATWRWTTSCTTTAQGLAAQEPNCATDSGLNTTGEVTVARSNTANGITSPLYRGGYPGFGETTVSEVIGQLLRGNIYLLNDLGPFYWLGDTAWAAPVRARFDAASTPNCAQTAGWDTNDWKCYVQDRVARGFTAIQISVPQWWMRIPLTDSTNQAPFVASGSFPAWSKWNPAFWQGFEEKVQYANEQGLLVAVVGIMEPSYQHLATDNPSFAQRYPPTADAKTFARNLAARLAGNFVVLSPGFDTRPDAGPRSALIRAVGAEIHAVSPRPHVANHFGGSTPVSVTIPGVSYDDYQDFHSEPWLDLHLFQSGQCRNLEGGGSATPAQQLQNFTQRARRVPRDLRPFAPRKGLANAEAIYDQDGAVLEPGQPAPANASFYRPYRARQTAYLSTLSGAFGATLGVYGLWDWGLGDGAAPAGPYQPRLPKDSVGRVSVQQLTYLANLFRAQRWDWLMPSDLVRNNLAETPGQPDLYQHLQMVVSRDLTRRSTLAYLPDNAEIRLQLDTNLYPSFSSARWSKRYFNPRSGVFDPRAVALQQVGGTTTSPVFSFQRLACLSGEPCNGQNGDRDWVLVLTDTTQGATSWAVTTRSATLQAWSVHEPESNEWRIAGQFLDGSGAPNADELKLGEPTVSLQRLPQVARASDGTFLVVWEAEELDGEAAGVFARVVSAAGVPQGQPFQVNTGSEGRQIEPIVTADGIGRLAVVWTSVAEGTEGGDVLLQRFGKEGLPVGGEILVNGGSLGRARAPLVSADPAGNLAVAWQSYDPASGASGVVVRRFDAAGQAVGGELVVEESTSQYLALERLEMDALGNFQVIWHRLLEGESQGHYGRSYDRFTDTLAEASMVTEAGF